MTAQRFHEPPSDWYMLSLNSCVLKNGVERKASVQQNGYKATGRFPIVDQGSSLIAGYTDDERLVHQDDLPIILFGDHTRVFKFLDFPFATGADGTKLFRTNEEIVDPRFLYYAFLHLDIPSRGYNRHFKYLKEKTVLAPSRHKEQRAIAAVLSKIQAAVEVQNKVVATLKELKTATMAKLFREGLRGEPLKQTEIGEIPESWEVVPVGKLLRLAQYGLSMRGEQSGRYPILRMNCQQDGQVIFRDLQFVDLSDVAFNSFKLRNGDLLFNRTNSLELVGRTAIFHGDRETVFASYLIRLRVDETSLVPDFLNYYLNLDGVQVALKSLATRGVSQSNISASKLKMFNIPRLPKDEQAQIVAILDRLSKALIVANQKRDTLKSLFSSMLHLLMTGQVRVTPKMIALQAVADWERKRKRTVGTVDKKIIEEIVDQIVELVSPEKIILFGSAAKGEMGPDSDLDFLVVKSCENRREMARTIYKNLKRVGIPIDIVVATPQDIEHYKDTIGLIYRPALREGKIVYAA